MNEVSSKGRDFRDRLATADKSGRRLWVFPTKPKGRLHRARAIVASFLLAFLFAAPFIRVNGNPLLQFNIIERHFFIFGMTFWPQDFHLFVLFGITLALFIVLLTAIYGRVFCGWACPQTIFLEMVFRKIEYLIDGTAGQQRKLAAAPLTATKLTKRVVKHTLFFGISFLIGNLLLAYIIGTEDLFKIISDPPSQHITGLTFMFLFSGLFYFVFASFREQACTLVCPYARLQSVLLDTNTIVVAYDHKRGEPRGPRALGNEKQKYADCIDCEACVRVCPTGIDIRNGTQLDCVNCTACIDACNDVMDRVGSPRGLIRYSSLDAIEKNKKFRITGRIIAYTVVLTLLASLMTILMLSRTDVEATIMRTPGSLFQETASGGIKNLYNIKLINKTSNEMPISLSIPGERGKIEVVGSDIVVDKNGLAESVFFIEIPKEKLFSPNSLVEVEVRSEGKLIETIRTNFMGPQPGR
ncbi:MAG: cytochrome c oxidase accessory protein CcoG [bacterium]|nr:cytochrome c oxidase accessory protein CcoG [bacterium]